MPAEVNDSRELQLAARSALVDHQLLRRPAGNDGAMVVLDESQRKVEPAEMPAEGQISPSRIKISIRIQFNLWAAAAEVVEAGPMGGGAATVEPSSHRQEIGT